MFECVLDFLRAEIKPERPSPTLIAELRYFCIAHMVGDFTDEGLKALIEAKREREQRDLLEKYPQQVEHVVSSIHQELHKAMDGDFLEKGIVCIFVCSDNDFLSVRDERVLDMVCSKEHVQPNEFKDLLVDEHHIVTRFILMFRDLQLFSRKGQFGYYAVGRIAAPETARFFAQISASVRLDHKLTITVQGIDMAEFRVAVIRWIPAQQTSSNSAYCQWIPK